MVAEQLPAPGLGGRGAAEQAEREAPFAEDRLAPDQLAEEPVEAHDRAGLFETARAEPGPQHVENGLAQTGPDFVETEAVVLQVELGVLPAPPHLRPHREMGPLALPGRHPVEQGARRRHHRVRRRPVRLQREQAGPDRAVRGDPGERPFAQRRPAIQELPRASGLRSDGGVLGRRGAGNPRLRGRGDEGSEVGAAHPGLSLPLGWVGRLGKSLPFPPSRRNLTQARQSGYSDMTSQDGTELARWVIF